MENKPIDFPQCSQPPSDAERKAPKAPNTSAGGGIKADYKSLKILVVDDEKDLREAVAFDFKRRGFTVLLAESGKQALETVRSQPVDLILSDIRMPEGDGMFLLEQVRALKMTTPLIFMTGYADYTKEECLQKGAFEVINKPFDRKMLLKLVLDALAINS